MFSDDQPRGIPRITRRHLLSIASLGAAGIVTGRSLALQPEATPPGSVAATPLASPAASPVASPAASPVATPEQLPAGGAVFPLEVIRDQRPVEGSEPVRGGELRMFIRPDDVTNFNIASFRQDFQVGCSLYDPLVWLDEVTLEPQPWLAESWKWSNNGLTLTFVIRDDVTWHDGSPLTASDVAFSFIVYQQDVDSAVSGFFSLVDRIASTDERTVVIDFAAPDGSFLFNAGNLFVFSSQQYGFYWSSQRLGERSLNGYNWQVNRPIGTGPWKLKDASETALTMERHDGYWAGETWFDTLQLTGQDDKPGAIDAWKLDEVDVVWPVAPLETTNLIQEEGRLYAADSLRTLFAAYNFNNPARFAPDLFAAFDFRQALLLAVDREGYRQAIFGSFIDIDDAGTITQPWARDPRIVSPKRNVAKANELLDDLGWRDNDGDGIREAPSGDVLNLNLIVREGANADFIALLQGLDHGFREIGVSLAVEILSAPEWTDRWVNTHEFDLIAYDLLQYGAFDEFDLYGSAWDIRTNMNGWNPGGYRNADVDAALDEWFAAYEIDDMRLAMYKLQRAVVFDPIGLFFGFPQDPVLVRPGVLGYQPNKMWQTWNTRGMWKLA